MVVFCVLCFCCCWGFRFVDFFVGHYCFVLFLVVSVVLSVCFFRQQKEKKPLIKQFSVNGANAFDENKLQNENKNSALVPSCTSPACLIFSIFHKWVFIHPCDLPMVAEIYYQGELAPVT